jgi:hypothetical protein
MNREELMGAFSYRFAIRDKRTPVILPADTTTFFWCDSVIAKLLWHDLR